ncbi:MAG: hypothetical protein E7599_00645 [Ruminococcaceae bacterium]|nr:hypothetical protein [Oscillospiraceae bacterium]
MGFLDFIKNLPAMNELTGSFGEHMAKLCAQTIPGALVLRDVVIDGADNYTSQIDLIIVGSKGIYVVEVKTFPDAKIYGDTQKTKWYVYNHGRKYEIYSPLKQNQKHVTYLKSFLKDYKNTPIFSIITMICEDYSISGDNPPETVICSGLPAMKKGIELISKDRQEIWNETQKEEIFTYIQNHQYAEKNARREHKEQVIAYKRELEKMKEKKMCPYCKTELVLRNGKYGSFYGCSQYPRCKYTLK